MVKEILKKNQGRMRWEELQRILKARGYHLLYERLEAMGFIVGDDGYVYGD